tara:strand:- start:731 stop:1645 length:915 start_codon:yes stop_codon:yes gene_type:complete
MGSIVKSIGKAIKKVGKFVVKAAPYILMAVALYAGIAAYGATAASATAAASGAGAGAGAAGAAGAPFLHATAAQSTAYIASTNAAAAASGNMFSYANYEAGTDLLASNIGEMTGTTTTLTGGTPAGTSIAAGDLAGAMGGGTAPVAEATSVGWYEGVKNYIATAMDGNKGYALLAGSQMLGTGISAIAAAFDDTEEKKLAFAEKQLKQQGTHFGFAPGEGRTPEEMPADSPFWMGYNQNLAMNAGAPVPGAFAHGIKQPTTSNRRTLNYDYSPKGVVTQSAAKTFNKKPQGMINLNQKGGVLNG